MTSARQKEKRRGRFAVAVYVATCSLALAPPAQAGLTQRIVVNWHTGLAIDGYDPVAFFTQGKPVPGSPGLELRYDGVIWRFSNIGNRAAFAGRPDIYMPQYGGYDPLAVARGVAVAGNPDVWLIIGERLFLFYDPAHRTEFAADAARVIAAANRKWPVVVGTLDP